MTADGAAATALTALPATGVPDAPVERAVAYTNRELSWLDFNERVLECADCSPVELEEVDRHFRDQIFPALTPLAVGPGRPFPYISNLSLSLAVVLRDPLDGSEGFARVKVPKEVLPRFLELGPDTFVP